MRNWNQFYIFIFSYFKRCTSYKMIISPLFIGCAASEVITDRYECDNYIIHGEFVKMLCDLIVDLQAQDSTEWIPTALYFMQILIKLCHDCSQNKSILSHHVGFIFILQFLCCVWNNKILPPQLLPPQEYINSKESQTTLLKIWILQGNKYEYKLKDYISKWTLYFYWALSSTSMEENAREDLLYFF